MRRILTLLTATFVMSALLGVSAQVLAAGAAPAPTLNPPAGQWSTDGNDALTFGGTVEPGATLINSKLRRFDSDGNCICHDANGFPINENVTSNTTISPEGTISGGRSAAQTPAHTKSYVLLVTVRNPDGSEATGQSPPLEVDQVWPTITRYELIGPDTIRVVFSEVVAYRSGLPSNSAGSGTDWTVSYNNERNPVLSVTGTGSERILTLANEYLEDDRPTVRFQTIYVERSYRDGSGKNVVNDVEFRVALDRFAPEPPHITSIAGRSSSEVVANQRDPLVVVSGLSNGHSAQLFEERDGVSGLSAGDRELGPAKRENGGSSTLAYPEASEGSNTLFAVALDASNNRSVASGGRYILDTIVPTVVSAEPVDNNFIQVVFTEPVFGTGNIGDWRVGSGAYPVTGVVGDGNSRLLRVSGVPSGTNVTYSPIAGTRFVDAAGNALGPFTKATTKVQPGTSGTGGGGTGGGGSTSSPSPDPTSSPGGGSGGSGGTPGPTPTPTDTPTPTPTETPSEPQEDIQARAASDDATVGACQDVAVTFYRNGKPAAGENIDVTLPDGLEFCDGTEGEHSEAFTDSSGIAVFRILSRNTRTTSVLAWHDKNGDDINGAGEKTKLIELTWNFDGSRALTIDGKQKVGRGKKVLLRGTMTAVMRRCEVDTAIEIVRQSGARSKVIDAVFTAADGSYSKRVRIKRTATYFARAQSIGGCAEAHSEGLLVKALRHKH